VKSTNKEFVQLENFILCFYAESMEGFWIVNAILWSKPMPHLWLYNKLWCFVLVAEYTLMVWENNLFSFYFWLRASFYWSLCKGGFEPGSQFQPHLHSHCQKWSTNQIGIAHPQFKIVFLGSQRTIIYFQLSEQPLRFQKALLSLSKGEVCTHH
jgi:hypothetical protein